MVTFHSMLVGALTALAMASPITGPGNSISVRQPMDSNDLQNEQCKDVTFIFARGSTEMGNMVCTHLLAMRAPYQSLAQSIQKGTHRGAKIG